MGASVVDIPGASTVASVNPAGQFVFITLPPGANESNNELLKPGQLKQLAAALKGAGALGIVVLNHGLRLDVLSEESLSRIGLQRIKQP